VCRPGDILPFRRIEYKNTAYPAHPHKISGSTIHESGCLLLSPIPIDLLPSPQYLFQAYAYLNTQSQRPAYFSVRAARFLYFSDRNNLNESL